MGGSGQSEVDVQAKRKSIIVLDKNTAHISSQATLVE
jgi:hypothetical protein